MRTSIITTILLIVFGTIGFAQTKDYSGIKKNSLYAETYLIRHDFSQGLISINYERNIGQKKRTNLRIGIYPDFESAVSFPITISWITKPLSPHHFEYGIGSVFRVEHFVDPLGINTREWFYDVPALMIPMMYRYQKTSGFFFRGGINLWVSWPTIPAPSFSIGYKF